MFWTISEEANNGYPSLSVWRKEWQTGWTSGNGSRYPDYMWRIDGNTNDGYPWIYPWFKSNVIDTGDLVIGGAQSNYPSGFTPSNIGGIENDFDDTNMNNPSPSGSIVGGITASSLNGKFFAVNAGIIMLVLLALNDPSIISTTAMETISKIYGANIFDCFIGCKVFPFNLDMFRYGNNTNVVSSDTAVINAFGQYGLYPNGLKMASSLGYYHFNTITVNPLQAWEIERIDYSIYLPMAGVFPLDIRGESEVDITLYVDFITGMGEYHVFINNQLVGTYRVMLGADVPLNTNQGRMQANMLTNVVSTFGKAVGAVASTVGLGTVGEMANLMNPFTEHYAMSTPSVGGLTSMQSYAFPRVIAKIPKMFKDGYGFKQTLGENRSTAYIQLGECSGYVRTKNYKTDIIIATDTEKMEIERLMNEGVFI